jgi:lysophospholipase L1-like esterase
MQALVIHSNAQRAPFYDEIKAFQKQDSTQLPPKNAVLFTGSSSIKLWTSLQKDLPMHSIINRGFGGSSLPDVIRYADEIIIPYQPAQVVIYCGDNDLASSDTVTAQIVAERFERLFSKIRKQLPEVPIAFISIKPSPRREHLLQKVISANELIKTFLNKQTKTAYIDVYSAMIDQQGKPKPELFVDDRLHMNQKGYAIWLQIIEPYLVKK